MSGRTVAPGVQNIAGAPATPRQCVALRCEWRHESLDPAATAKRLGVSEGAVRRAVGENSTLATLRAAKGNGDAPEAASRSGAYQSSVRESRQVVGKAPAGEPLAGAFQTTDSDAGVHITDGTTPGRAVVVVVASIAENEAAR